MILVSLCEYFVGSRMSSRGPQWAHHVIILLLMLLARPHFTVRVLIFSPQLGQCELNSKAIYRKLLSIELSPPILPQQWTRLLGRVFP